MILEAFQGAIARQADGLLHFAVGYFVMMTGLAVAVIASIVRKRGGHQPSSTGGAPTTGIPSGGSSGSRERPEPPRSGSGVIRSSDPSFQFAALRAELASITYSAEGAGFEGLDNPSLMKQVADRLQYHHDEKPSVDYIQALRRRAEELELALIHARRTLEATKLRDEPPIDTGGIV